MTKLSIRIWLILTVFCFFVVGTHLAQAKTIHKNDEGVYDIADGAVSFSLRTQAGNLTGTATETVYQSSSSDALLSELTWEIDKLYMVGIGFSLHYNWFALHFDYWVDAEEGDGTMDDYDWMVSGQDWTDWSHHEDTEVSEAHVYDLNAEFLIPPLSWDKFVISGFLGYKKENYEWISKGGSYIYTSATFRDTVGTFPASQIGISYKQTYSTPYLGIGLHGSLGKFELSSRIIGSKWSKVKTRDHHYLRWLSINTKMDDGDMYSGDIELSYNFTKKLSLGLAYTYTKHDEMRGDALYDYLFGPTFSYENGQSVDLETSLLSLTFAYTF